MVWILIGSGLICTGLIREHGKESVMMLPIGVILIAYGFYRVHKDS